jgi:hypothetical protein
LWTGVPAEELDGSREPRRVDRLIDEQWIGQVFEAGAQLVETPDTRTAANAVRGANLLSKIRGLKFGNIVREETRVRKI